MKAILHQIEGVLNTYADDGLGPIGLDPQFHEPAVRALKRLVKKADAKIVVMSTWQPLVDVAEKVSREEAIVDEIIGETPRYRDSNGRNPRSAGRVA